MMFSTSLPLESGATWLFLLMKWMGCFWVKVIEFRGMTLRFLTTTTLPSPIYPGGWVQATLKPQDGTTAGQKQLCLLSYNLSRVIQEHGSTPKQTGVGELHVGKGRSRCVLMGAKGLGELEALTRMGFPKGLVGGTPGFLWLVLSWEQR